MSRNLRIIPELAQVFWPRYDFPADIEIPAFIHAGGPFHQSQLTIGQFQTGDGSRMYTGTGIVIEAARFHGKERPMGVTCHQYFFPDAGPVAHALLGKVFSGVVFRGTGGILNPGKLQRLPKISNHPACGFPELVVQKICLVAVDQMKVRTSILPPDDQPLRKDRCQKGKTVRGAVTNRFVDFARS